MSSLWQRFQRARREVGFVGVIRQAIRNRNPIQCCVLYRICDLVKSSTTSSTPVLGDLFIQRYTSWADIEATKAQALLDHGGENLRAEFDQLFAAGSTLWLGELDGGCFAGVCWHTQPREREDYFVPLTAIDTTIYACFVVPDCRGRGVYPRMLSHLVDTLRDEAMSTIYIDCKRWNKASIRGIEKAGFEYVGQSWRIVRGGKARYFWNACVR